MPKSVIRYTKMDETEVSLIHDSATGNLSARIVDGAKGIDYTLAADPDASPKRFWTKARRKAREITGIARKDWSRNCHDPDIPRLQS